MRMLLPSSLRFALGVLTAATVLAACGDSSGDPAVSGDPGAKSSPAMDVPAGTIVFRRFTDDQQSTAALFTMRSDGSGERQLTEPPVGAIDSFPDWSPDGTRVAFSREFADKPYEVYVVNADGSDERLVDPGCPPRISSRKICEEENPAWSPDGKSLAFSWAGGDLRQVRGEETIELAGLGVVRPDGSGATLVTQTRRPTTSEDKSAMWSPDGKQLGFIRLNITARPFDGQAFFVSDADGTHAERITPWELAADDPAWSPDGALISFRSEPNPDEDFVGDIYTVRPDGSDLTKITDAKGQQVLGSSFSPDSAWIVFAMSGVDNWPDLYVMRRDGSDLTPLTRTPAWDSAPDWSPR